MLAGISTLGIVLGYSAESSAGVKPTAFTKLNRINSIGGIKLETNTIDASAMEDMVEKSIAGRASTGGSWSITINYTSETEAEWNTLIEAYNTAKLANKQMWFEVYSPSLTKAFFVVAEPPQDLPMPEMSANSLMTMEITLAISDYKGLDTAIVPTAAS